MGRAFALALLLFAPAALEAAPYEVVERSEMLGYLLHLPDGYAASEAHFPLLFFLHGIAQKGDGSASELQRVAEDGPFRALREGTWDNSLPFIVVGPQSGGLQPWWRGEAVRQLLDHVLATYRIDPRRRYLSGISMGGRSVWWLARNFSDEFAALVPVSAWAGDMSHSCARFRGVGIWAFHGERDGLIRPASGRKPIDVLDGCQPELDPLPHFTLLTGAGHGQWDRVYANHHGDSNKGGDGASYSDIYRWMLSFAR